MVEGKKKGNRAERDVAREISAWLRDGDLEADDIDNPDLWLSKLSGGWEFRDAGDVGDLQPNSELGAEFRSQFAVEVKHYEEIEWWEVFTRKSPDIIEWWDDHWEECEELELCPLLIMRANYRPWLVGHPADLFAPAQEVRQLTIEDRRVRFIEWSEWTDMSPDFIYKYYEQWRERRFG